MTPAAWGYLALGLLALAVAWWKGLDRDDGGMYDVAGRWHPWPDDYFVQRDGKTRVAPDKVQHSGFSHILTFVAGFLMPVYTAAALTFALGFGWELQQMVPRVKVWVGVGTNARVKRRGKFSWRDLVADALGCAGGVLFHVLVRFLLRLAGV